MSPAIAIHKAHRPGFEPVREASSTASPTGRSVHTWPSTTGARWSSISVLGWPTPDQAPWSTDTLTAVFRIQGCGDPRVPHGCRPGRARARRPCRTLLASVRCPRKARHHGALLPQPPGGPARPRPSPDAPRGFPTPTSPTPPSSASPPPGPPAKTKATVPRSGGSSWPPSSARLRTRPRQRGRRGDRSPAGPRCTWAFLPAITRVSAFTARPSASLCAALGPAWYADAPLRAACTDACCFSARATPVGRSSTPTPPQAPRVHEQAGAASCSCRG